MLNNLVFVSGPHGAGKSTLIKDLIKKVPNAVSPNLETRVPQFYWGDFEGRIDFSHRQALKYAQRAIENYEYWVLALREPDKIVIGDRCIYDSKTYRIAGVDLGWMNKEENHTMENNLKVLYTEDLLSPRAIIFNPEFAIIRANLEKRWRETGWIKFKEKDMGYLKTVCNSFKSFKGQKDIFYLNSRPNEDSMNQIADWVSNP